MLPYGIGLDIGITSVGWATVALDRDDLPFGIIGMGSRIFDAAENPKTGASLAAPRREARSMRRRLRRHAHRNERIRRLLIGSGILAEEQLAQLFSGQLSDIYQLRVNALDQLVSNEEFARILIHISQRRGFKSNRKGAASGEDGELLNSVNANKARMEQNRYRTVAEMLLKDEVYQDHRRNKGGKYIATVSRDMVADEVRQIFSAQRKLGSQIANEQLETAYLEILLSQRSFDAGPGGNSPYAGSQIERMIGNCTFEDGEPRAARAAYSFEYFSLLEAVNHIRLVHNGGSEPLSSEQREQIVALAHKTADLNYAKIRKELGIAESLTFNTVSYRSETDQAQAEKKTKLNCLKAYHQMRTGFDKLSKGHFATFTKEQRNEIAYTLSVYKTSDNIRPRLASVGLTDAEIDIAETLNFSKFGHLSIKACEKLIPFLERGMKYNEACEAAGYAFRGHEGMEKSGLLPPLDEKARNTITSPVVQRAISQAIKVVNAIIRERGSSPTFINIELAREMSKDFSERNKIKKEQDSNRAENERRMERIRTEFHKSSPTGQDLVKLRLYEEQGGISPYSQKPIRIEHLFDSDYAEVDHIIPYSISFDDTYKNKVLVLAGENRDKGNRLPLEYLTGEKRDNYIVWVNSSVRDYRKRQQLLKESITPEDVERFKERNLQDTKTASSFFMNYLNDHLSFAPFQTERKKRVTAVNGSVTSYLRKHWGITKIRANGDLHHAVDALVIACTTDGMIRAVSQYAQYRETRYLQEEGSRFIIDPATGEIKKEFPYPWPWFRKELEARLGSDPQIAVMDQGFPVYADGDIPVHPIFVSRMPRRKVTGAAHLQTVKSGKSFDGGYLIIKKPLADLKLDNTGEIAGYYRPQDDRLLYEALKDRLKAFGGNGTKAFAEPFYKPKSDGSPGPLVRKVKLWEKSTLAVSLHGGSGMANHDTMVRVDVFHIEGDGYYLVPIYVADTLKAELPNRAVIKQKPYAEWKEMREEDFLFSLYPNDLVRAVRKKPFELKKSQADSDLPDTLMRSEELLYFISMDINSAVCAFRNHDNSYSLPKLGIKTLDSFEKYTVDVLGNYYPVHREKRLRFRNGED